jgi:hypothetical protein
VAVRAFCGHYAGRRPIAATASLTGLPERVVSWLGSSLGGAAAAVKVVALAALVGGVAVGSSALGLPAARRGSRGAATLSSAQRGGQARHAGQAGHSPLNASTPSARAHRAAARTLAGSTSHGKAPLSRAPASGLAVASAPSHPYTEGPPAGARTGPGGGPAGEGTHGKEEGHGKEVAHGKEEVHGKEEGHGKEVGKGKEGHGKEVVMGKEEGHGAGGGAGKEAHGKEEGQGKPEAPRGKSEESPGGHQAEEHHGPSEEAHGKGEGGPPAGKGEEGHGPSQQGSATGEEAAHGRG